MFGRVPKSAAPFVGTRPKISESHSEISARVPFCIVAGQISATELSDGRVLALLRPSWEESMWEVWGSAETGADPRADFSWGPLARGRFPMYASPDAFLTTAAGVLLIGGRFPASDLPCNVRGEGGQSLVIGGPSLVMLEGKACHPL